MVSYARVCVMLDYATVLPKHLVVMLLVTEGTRGGVCKIDVEYEWLPSRCSMCHRLGHTADKCALKKKSNPKPEVKVYVQEPECSKSEDFQQVITKGKNVIVEHEGRWMMEWQNTKTTVTTSADMDKGKELVLSDIFELLHEILEYNEEIVLRGPKDCRPLASCS